MKICYCIHIFYKLLALIWFFVKLSRSRFHWVQIKLFVSIWSSSEISVLVKNGDHFISCPTNSTVRPLPIWGHFTTISQGVLTGYTRHRINHLFLLLFVFIIRTFFLFVKSSLKNTLGIRFCNTARTTFSTLQQTNSSLYC